MKTKRYEKGHGRSWLVIGLVFLLGCGQKGGTESVSERSLMHVSFDATRPLFAEYNQQFARHYKNEQGQRVSVKQTHGGSGKQARAVIDGLNADVVSLALSTDVEALVENGGLVNKNWQNALPEGASPFSSTIVLLVRKGNPKKISDFGDLARSDVHIIAPNPKTSGGARFAYLAAWAYALKSPGGSPESARAFVQSIYSRVVVMDSGARASLTTFLERNLGDVLLAWENEALFAAKELAPDKVEIVTPSASILAEPKVAVVERVANQRKSVALADAYLRGLFAPEAQDLAGRYYFRPRQAEVMAKYRGQFKALTLYRVDELFGSLAQANRIHFVEGGVFDQITAKPRP